MTEAYELYEESNQNYKWQRRAKKRRKSLEALDKKNKKNVSSINSHKTFFIVKLIFDNKEHSFEIPANKYVGHPDEFKEIKQLCINKYGKGVRILNIVTN